MSASRPRKILVINQYYAPDVASTGQLAAELCSGLPRQGFEVHVVTGQPSYTASSPDAPSFEVRDGVAVYRVPLGKAKGRERLRIRLEGYLRFLWQAWRQARKVIEAVRPDTVFTFHNPPFVGFLGASLARRYGLQFVYAPYDIHPDILLATGWKIPRPIVAVWDALHRRVLAQADALIVLGEGMGQTLQAKGVPATKINVIPPWGQPELQPTPKDQVLPLLRELDIGEGELIFLYAGNMGVMHPLDPILDAATALRGLPVRFLFVGDGVRRYHVESRIKEERLRQVIRLPYQPEERFSALVAAADACFVVLEPGLERLAVPSRAFTFLSAGRPLIAWMAPEADVARLVREAECGWCVTSSAQLVGLIKRLLQSREELAYRGKRAMEVYEQRFQRDRLIEAYARVFESI